ncbi:MAG: hypothetical protein MUP60_00195 [Candidatus Thorarchaeota archaeon]|nr:hypothetical protein [Candidatus Thorarchaeota archaeon]
MPRIRGRRERKKSTPSRVGGLGSKASSRSPSHVGGLGSKASSRSGAFRRSSGSSTSKPFRIRRPLSRPAQQRTHYGVGMGYPRRYRTRPMSSCGCFTVFIALAILWLIFLAPSIVISLDATLALVLPIVVVLGLFIVALWFITKIVDGNDGDREDGQTTVIERERVLVVCPYCGAKNEQGIAICVNCDAEI